MSGPGTETGGRLQYVYSCDLRAAVEVKVMSVEGELGKPSCAALAADPALSLCAALPAADPADPKKALFVTATLVSDGAVVGRPVTTAYKAPGRHWTWNQWLPLPLTYAELSRDAALLLNVWDLHHDPATPHCVAGTALSLFSKRGLFRRGIYDLKLRPFQQITPDNFAEHCSASHNSASATMRRLAKLSKKHQAGLLEKVDWLDRLVFREIEVVNEAEKRLSSDAFLILQFARVHHGQDDYSVVYFERNAAESVWHLPNPPVVKYLDPELGLENLVEAKHHQLTRSARSAVVDRDLKPNAQARQQLHALLALPSSQPLSAEQRDLVWKFRFHLSNQPRALTKFLASVQWDTPAEASQAEALLSEWAPIDAEDALELLNPDFLSPAVRRYAVSRLSVAPLDEILLYLPQLVQALRYEAPSTEDPDRAVSPISPASPSSPVSPTSPAPTPVAQSGDTDLAGFLVAAAVKDFAVANQLFWCLSVESQVRGKGEEGMRGMFVGVRKRVERALMQGGQESRRRRGQLVRQAEMVAALVRTMAAVAKEGGARKAKLDALKRLLDTPPEAGAVNFRQLDGLPHPLDPNVRLQSLLIDKAMLFKSSLMPAKLTFLTTDGREYPTIFKVGDDLRQDQLILQMVELMDRVLKKASLDLRLTPYRAVATSLTDGFVQFVDSMPIRDVLHRWGSIREFFQNYRPSSKGPLGIEATVLENYVRSLAGYSVISYILGIGDRHLHNLLLCQDGHMFHIDFGFILGRDPKPMPPPVKLTKEMLDGLGGIGSPGWDEFRRLSYTAFIHLRRHAALLLNLWRLMSAASIPDIAAEPDKAVAFLLNRFHLHLDDEQAVKLWQHILDSSVSAKIALISDFIHDLVQTAG